MLVFCLFPRFLQIFHTGNHIFHEYSSETGQMLFYDIENVYSLETTLEHACIVDLRTLCLHAMLFNDMENV